MRYKFWDVISSPVQDDAQKLSPGLFQLLFSAESNLPTGPTGLDHQNHAVDLGAEDPALWNAE